MGVFRVVLVLGVFHVVAREGERTRRDRFDFTLTIGRTQFPNVFVEYGNGCFVAATKLVYSRAGALHVQFFVRT